MRRSLFLAVCSLSLLSSACDRPAIDSSTSLVGAKTLPPAHILNQETILLGSKYDRTLSTEIEYQFTPDNLWTVSFRSVPDGKVLRKKEFKLSKERAEAIRNLLWRLRPEELRGVQYTVDPADCPKPPTDTPDETAIAFVNPGSARNESDDRYAIFTLPYLSVCNSPQNREAHRVFKEATRDLPLIGLMAEYNHLPPYP